MHHVEAHHDVVDTEAKILFSFLRAIDIDINASTPASTMMSFFMGMRLQSNHDGNGHDNNETTISRLCHEYTRTDSTLT
jgi:hypothetical protein